MDDKLKNDLKNLGQDLQNAWKGARRVFCRSCPSCGANDVDQPSGKKIIRTVLSSEMHTSTRPHYHHGKMELKTHAHYDKKVRFQCQACSHEWTEHQEGRPTPW